VAWAAPELEGDKVMVARLAKAIAALISSGGLAAVLGSQDVSAATTGVVITVVTTFLVWFVPNSRV